MASSFIRHTHTLYHCIHSPLVGGGVTILVHLAAGLVLPLPPGLLDSVEEVQLTQPRPGEEPPEVTELQQLCLCQQPTLRRERTVGHMSQ